MRIVVWNCAMALHAKWERLMSLDPDVAVIPECANPDILWKKLGGAPRASMAWVGNLPNKGLAVFGFGDYQVEAADHYDDRFSFFLPVAISGPTPLYLLAVWAFNHRGRHPEGSKIQAPTVSAIQHYRSHGLTGHSVVAGDFNHSVQWDRQLEHHSNFSRIAATLEDIGLTSAYHGSHSLDFGKEAHPTHFFRKGPLEYHIDYCFVPRAWKPKVTIGPRESWVGVSDHAPMIIEI